MPFGLEAIYRNILARSRIVTLTSDNHDDIIYVMYQIVNYIFLGARQGINGFDQYGRQVRLMLSIVTNFGDYPSAAAWEGFDT